jgi:hypothetical protein
MMQRDVYALSALQAAVDSSVKSLNRTARDGTEVTPFKEYMVNMFDTAPRKQEEQYASTVK